MKWKSFVLLCSFVFLLSPHFVEARPLTSADRGYEFQKLSEDTVVKSDGASSSHYIYRYKILSEEGVRTFSVYRVSYNANTQRVDLNKITITNPEGITEIDPKNVEDKSLFSGFSSYDETKTKVIPLPNLKIGSIIDLDYVHHVLRPPFPGVISGRYFLTYSSDVGDLSFKITAPASATLRLHDPSEKFKNIAQESSQGDMKTFSVALKDDKGIGTALETADFTPPEKLAWVDVSGLKSFEEAAGIAAKGFDKSLDEALPEKLKTLFGEKPTQPLSKDEAGTRLTTILKTIADNFRYFGDWRSVDGGFVPRSLAEIAATGYGDCKDFSVLVASAARYLGLKGDVVLTHRASDPFQIATIPNLLIYNHAITRVGVPGINEIWWIDATNPIPNVGLIPADIAGRHALILGDTPGKADIPRDGPDKSTQAVDITFDTTASPDQRLLADIKINGYNAWLVKTELFGRSPQQIQEYMVGYLGISNYDAKDFKLITMASEPEYPYTVHFQFEVTESNGIGRAGGLKILQPLVFGSAQSRIMDVVSADRHSDLYLGALETVRVTQKFAKGSYKEIVGTPQSCEIDSPWIQHKRGVLNGDGFILQDAFTQKSYRVPLQDIRSAAFLKAQKDLRDCLRGIRVVVR